MPSGVKPDLPGVPEPNARFSQSGKDEAAGIAPVVERNIAALIERRKLEDLQRGLEDRIAERIARFTGSMTFVYFHLFVFGGWIVANVPWTPLPKFDPSFVTLAMVASVEAIFLSTFVLITQNRLARATDKRADLDLQISLLAEHEITRLIHLVSAMGEKLGVEQAKDPALAELKRDVAPEQVLERLDAAE
jgi:uncharacterized membrane protein